MVGLFDTSKYDVNAPFFRQLEDGATTEVASVEGSVTMPRAMVNLMFIKREVRLAAKGIKPYRGWSAGNVSTYLGCGRKNSKQLVAVVDEMLDILESNL